MQGNGLGVINKYQLLSTENSVVIIVDTLSLISQLARISKDFYENIHNANIYQDLKNLIVHSDASIRAKVCNLIGNLCRHTGFFYEKLLKFDWNFDCLYTLCDKLPQLEKHKHHTTFFDDISNRTPIESINK